MVVRLLIVLAYPNPTGDISQASQVAKNATVYAYTQDGLEKAVHLPWGEGQENSKRYREDFRYNAVGDIASVDAPYEWSSPDQQPCGEIPNPDQGPCQKRTAYTTNDAGWITTERDPTLKDPETGNPVYEHVNRYAYDKHGNQTKWSVTGESADDVRRSVCRSYFPNGMLKVKGAAERRDDCAGPTARSYSFTYNKNHSLTSLKEKDEGEGRDRVTRLRYDWAERQTSVDETWQGGKDTAYSYDKDGDLIETKTDGRLEDDNYIGGKETTSQFDPLGRETETKVCTTSSCRGALITRNSYYPSGDLATQVRPSGVIEERLYTPADEPLKVIRTRQGAAGPTRLQDYAYDKDGNQTLNERGTYAYNAKGQLTDWTRGQGPDAGTQVHYTLDGAGAIAQKVDNGSTTTYNYLGDRLTSSETDGETTSYSYDDLGALTKIEPPNGEPITYRYDAFERLIESKAPGQEEPTRYTYDGLDRREQKTVGGQTYDLSYVGLSEALSREEGPEGVKTYDYDQELEPLGQRVAPAGGEATYSAYSLDAQGSVEALEKPNGRVQEDATYHYDPYGALENDNPDELGGEAQANPIRFEGFYYEENATSYDMQARAYKPELQRFLSQDRFESPSDDLALQQDPTTQNRYAFAGGDPVDMVEVGGHKSKHKKGGHHGGGGHRGGGGGHGGGGHPAPRAAKPPPPPKPPKPPARPRPKPRPALRAAPQRKPAARQAQRAARQASRQQKPPQARRAQPGRTAQSRLRRPGGVARPRPPQPSSPRSGSSTQPVATIAGGPVGQITPVSSAAACATLPALYELWYTRGNKRKVQVTYRARCVTLGFAGDFQWWLKGWVTKHVNNWFDKTVRGPYSTKGGAVELAERQGRLGFIDYFFCETGETYNLNTNLTIKLQAKAGSPPDSKTRFDCEIEGTPPLSAPH